MSNTKDTDQIASKPDKAEELAVEELMTKLKAGDSISKKEALRCLDEGVLSQSQFVAGHSASTLDRSILGSLKQFGLLEAIGPRTHPHLFAWSCLLQQFHDAVTLAWPAPDQVASDEDQGSKNVASGEVSAEVSAAATEVQRLKVEQKTIEEQLAKKKEEVQVAKLAFDAAVKVQAEKEAAIAAEKAAQIAAEIAKKTQILEAIEKSLRQETDHEADARREKQQWENYVPQADKRPLDEFYDLSTIEPECIEAPADITKEQDGGIIKYLMKPTTSRFPRACEGADIVYYTHETRFDNGQLVDFEEKRKVKEKFEMANLQQHEHIRQAFQTMKKGEAVWIKISPKYHGNIYHNFCKRTHLSADSKIGEFIYIKLFVDSIKRSPVYKDSKTYEGKWEYFDTVRTICKELVAEEEYANAQQLYSRCLGEFKNMPKKIRDGLTEEQKTQRIDTMIVLNLNLSLCHFKRGFSSDAIKHAKEAVALDPKSSKAHYRLAVAHKLNNDLDPAKEHLAEAVKLEPTNVQVRKEYQELVDLRKKKEKEWYSKMSGFYDSDKMKKIEEKDEQHEKLRYKIKRQTYREREHPARIPRTNDEEQQEGQVAQPEPLKDITSSV